MKADSSCWDKPSDHLNSELKPVTRIVRGCVFHEGFINTIIRDIWSYTYIFEEMLDDELEFMKTVRDTYTESNRSKKYWSLKNVIKTHLKRKLDLLGISFVKVLKIWNFQYTTFQFYSFLLGIICKFFWTLKYLKFNWNHWKNWGTAHSPDNRKGKVLDFSLELKELYFFCDQIQFERENIEVMSIKVTDSLKLKEALLDVDPPPPPNLILELKLSTSTIQIH